MANTVKITATLEDKVSSGLAKIRDQFELVGGKGSAASLFGNVGAKAVAVGFNLIANAAQGAVGFLGDVVSAGIADQQSVAKLGASLKANVPNWNGNTDAIERTIRSAQKLGFQDDELRDSLARLVAATHDVGKAQQIQNVAMDLARFKGISLADASDALIRVEGGQYRALKSLGIVLKTGATQTEALAAVEKVAKGQAEAFAQTTGGKLLVAQVAINEAMERAGTTILPLVTEGLNNITFALDQSLVPLARLKQAAAAGVVPAQAELQRLTDAAKANGISIEELYTAWSGSGQSIEAAAKRLADEGGVHLGKVADDIANVGTVSQTTADNTKNAFSDMTDAAVHYSDRLEEEKNRVTGYFDVIMAKDDLAAANTAVNVAKTSAERHKAQADQFRLLEDLASHGQTSSKIFTDTMTGLYGELHKAHGAEKVAIQAEIDYLKKLEAAAADAAARVKDAVYSGKSTKGGKQTAFASGGYMAPGTVNTVGEEGRETVVMGASGGAYVIPNTGGGGGGSNGGTTVHTVINLDGRQIAAIVDYYNASGLGRAAPTLGRT
jgi:hypothetical protein